MSTVRGRARHARALARPTAVALAIAIGAAGPLGARVSCPGAGCAEPAGAAARQSASDELPESYRLVSVWEPPLPDPGPTLYHPEGIDVSSRGLVAVAETGNELVSVWGLRGDAQGRWGGGGLAAPEDVAFSPDGNRLYVADTGHRRVVVLDGRTGAFVTAWPGVGLPRGVAVAPDGARVFVSDAEAGQVVVLSADGAELERWDGAGGPGSGQGSSGGGAVLREPLGLTTAPDGHVIVADHSGQRVVWLAPDGTLTRELDLAGRDGPGGAPRDVALTAGGDLLVAVDRGVLRFRPDARYAETIPPLREVPRDGCLPGRCCVDFVPVEDNHEGVRRVAATPGGGLYFTYAPALRWKDRVIAHPERWDPLLWPACGRPLTRHATDPERIDAGRDPYIHVLGSAPAVHVLRPDGEPLVYYEPVGKGPGNDLAAGGIAGAIAGCRDRARTYTAVITGNQVMFGAVHDHGCAVCPSAGACCPQPSIDILDPERLRDDPEDAAHWARAVSFLECGLSLAVLDAGRPQVVLRSYATPGSGGDPDTYFLPPMPAGRRLPGPRAPLRAYSDLEYAPDGSLWALTRDGALVPLDPHGRLGDEIVLTGLAGRAAEALAVQSTRSVFVLTHDGWVLKYWTDGTPRAAWSVPEQAGAGRYTDIAVDRDQRLLVVDGAGDRVLVFALADDGGSGPPPAPGTACRIETAKTADPARLMLGETTAVTLSLHGECEPTPRDVVLVVDGSCQMTGERMVAAREGGRRLLDGLAPADRLAVVTFTDEGGGARLRVALGADRSEVREALRTLPTECLPPALFPGRGQEGRVADGLRAGREALLGAQARPEAEKVLLLVTPSRFDAAAELARLEGGATAQVTDRAHALWEARRLWDAGAQVVVIGMGPDTVARRHGSDQGLLAALALPAAAYHYAAAAPDLAAAIHVAARAQRPERLFRQLEITDELPANMRLVPGSVWPPAETLPDGRLRWTFSDVPPDAPPVVRLLLEPLAPGLWPTNVEARAVFTDGWGRAGDVPFPVPFVEVLAPTPTAVPSATATSTMEPTPTPPATATATAAALPTATASVTPSPAPPPDVYLPLAYRPRCKPSLVPIDVAIVLDTSTSMRGANMSAAVAAAGQFLSLLQLPRDHAAVVSFDRDARVVQGLTGDRSALERALSGLSTAVGTRMDLGLWTAIDEVGGRGRLDADGVIVLLTDGRPQGGTEPDIALAAATARSLRLTVYAIGLGDDVQPLVLEIIAGGPERVHLAPGPEDLAAIYAAIAREIPCR